ncbi:hypothetical protein F5141DRAFT_1065252 [Pisolithus sp. B1]|nr:hypothetical protein F5141DRAFT_1065252 [Pisolithus sp. B1]
MSPPLIKVDSDCRDELLKIKAVIAVDLANQVVQYEVEEDRYEVEEDQALSAGNHVQCQAHQEKWKLAGCKCTAGDVYKVLQVLLGLASTSGKFANTHGHVTELSHVTIQFATCLECLSLMAGRTTSGYAKPAQLSGCKRLCDVCIDILESIASCLGTHKISFKCPACHKEECAAHSKPMLYFHMKAFTQIVQGKSVPACSTPTFVKGVCGGPILILHFICMGLNTRGGIPHLLNAALEEYFMEATLRYLEVVFDFGTWHKLCHWQTEAQCLAATIGEDTFQQKIIFISIHSEVTHGDLFVGKDEGGDDMAVLPKEFMDYLFAGHLWLFVVIQGHDLGEVFTDLLNVSVELPMHTDIYLFQVEEQMVSGMPNPLSSAIHVKGMRYS